MKIITRYISQNFISSVLSTFLFFIVLLGFFSIISSNSGAIKSQQIAILIEFLELPSKIYELFEIFFCIGTIIFTIKMSQSNQIIPALSINYGLTDVFNLLVKTTLIFSTVAVFILYPISYKMLEKSIELIKIHNPKILTKEIKISIKCENNGQKIAVLLTTQKDFEMQKINQITIKNFQNTEEVSLSDVNLNEIDKFSECEISQKNAKNIILESIDSTQKKKSILNGIKKFDFTLIFFHLVKILKTINVVMITFLLNLTLSRRREIDGMKIIISIVFAVFSNFMFNILDETSQGSFLKNTLYHTIPAIALTINMYIVSIEKMYKQLD